LRARPDTAAALVAFALLGGALQILASVALGLARVDALHAAANEGATRYVLAVLASSTGLALAWLVRKRPLVAVGVLLAGQALVLWPLVRRTSSLGFAYHGEFILHHFTALVAAAACFSLARHWARRRDHGAVRWLPAALGSGGATLLLLAHVLSQPAIASESAPRVQTVGATLLLSAAPVALAIGWRARDRFGNVALAALLVPYVLRVAFALPDGLTGASVVDSGRVPLVSAFVVSSAIAFVVLRSRIERPLAMLATVVAACETAILYVVYRRAFGDFEDGLGGLAQSLFAFSLPYPSYLETWRIVAASCGIFFALATVHTTVLSQGDRGRGLALGLLLVTGLGLSTPQLALMAGAGLLLVMSGEGLPPLERSLPTREIDEIVRDGCARLGLPPPVALDEGSAAKRVLVGRGELDDVSVDVRVHGGRDIKLRVGVIGRGRPELEIVPDASGGGHRPAHALASTHRVEGSQRALERGDAVLDALMPFPGARARLWAAGAEVELGPTLASLDAERLAMLVRVLVDR
jgi:hypothetical protein